MIGLFKRSTPVKAPDTAALGKNTVALRCLASCVVPQGCVGVVFDKGGATRRIGEGGRIVLAEREGALCFHPGPYSIDLIPFAAAPELGLQLTFVIDCPDPRVAQQRFELYLASEAGDSVQLAEFSGAIEGALQRELAQGNLELAPCTSIDEWNQFRSGVNRLLYQRFGITVEDCVPVDLGDRVDYAQLLLARAVVAPAVAVAEKVAARAAIELTDAQALRRLFLELPRVTSALRLVAMPPGQSHFRQHQQLLQRFDHVTLLFETMPALELAAPGKLLGEKGQTVRVGHSRAATAALDEAWALLARLPAAVHMAALFDDADRILANLEYHGALRREAP